jgi:hypothetical protein
MRPAGRSGPALAVPGAGQLDTMPPTGSWRELVGGIATNGGADYLVTNRRPTSPLIGSLPL